MIAKILISLFCFLGTTGMSHHAADLQCPVDEALVCATDGPSWQSLQQIDVDQWGLRRLAQRVSRRGGLAFSVSCPSVESSATAFGVYQAVAGLGPVCFFTQGHPQFIRAVTHLSHPCRVFLHQRHLF